MEVEFLPNYMTYNGNMLFHYTRFESALKIISTNQLLFGDFSKTEEKSFPENIARNAGAIFLHEGRLIRPAQECNKSYGHAISFQTVSIKQGQFEFQEEFRYYSTHPKYQRGTHTFNTYNGLAVIDVHKLRFPFLGGLYIGFKDLLVKLHLKKPFEIK